MVPAPGVGAFELLSGPDLGGGFLHQLSVERSAHPPRFIFHAQEGGVDANGPPKGSPVPFGWKAAPGMCPLGGRLCWHREFELPVSESLRVRTAYNRTRFVMEAMTAHEYGGVEVPLGPALEEIADRLNGAAPRIDWFVGGTLALWVRGAAVRPRAASLGTTREGVARIDEALRDYVIEPPAPTDWPGGPVLGGRAFVGTLKAGVRTSWGVPAEEGATARLGEWTFLAHAVAPEIVRWHGRDLPLAPVSASVVRWAEAGRDDRLSVALPMVQADPGRGLLSRCLEASTLTPAARKDLLRRA